jgi:hypothetical protein
LQNKKINVTGTGTDLGKSYVTFIRNNMDTIAKRITDDLWILNVMEVKGDMKEGILQHILLQKWYFDQMQMLATWLTERLDKSLNPYQCTCLSYIVKVRVPAVQLHLYFILFA